LSGFPKQPDIQQYLSLHSRSGRPEYIKAQQAIVMIKEVTTNAPHILKALAYRLFGVIFFGLTASAFASAPLDALVNAAGRFSTAIQNGHKGGYVRADQHRNGKESRPVQLEELALRVPERNLRGLRKSKRHFTRISMDRFQCCGRIKACE